ncbi:MAG: VOC family protein [Candidatus Pacebacteria bacterium]|nr:VOC family protein [Candidatus Paceibacterota bacterium]MBP9842682.1 VOC family protein [Candidatus Paceibacterota bacterium]
MKTIKPWINFNGNAEEAFIFYRTVFGGEFTKLIRFKDIASEEFQVSEKDADKIMNITLSIGSINSLIGNDVPEFMGRVNEDENRSKIHIDSASKEEAVKIFSALSAGGQVEVSPDDSAEEVFAMFRDKYGIEWIVEFNHDA